MLYGDTAVSVLVQLLAGALAALPPASLPSCTGPRAREDAVHVALATRATPPSGTLDLSYGQIVQEAFTAAAFSCGATTVAVSLPATGAVAGAAATLYGTALAELSIDNTASASAATTRAGEDRVSELSAMPLAALTLAARVSYVVQSRGAAALAALGGNPGAASTLVAGTWARGAAAADCDAVSLFRHVVTVAECHHRQCCPRACPLSLGCPVVPLLRKVHVHFLHKVNGSMSTSTNESAPMLTTHAPLSHAEWPAQLSAAPVGTNAIAAALGLAAVPPAAAVLGLRVRATGPLARCQVGCMAPLNWDVVLYDAVLLGWK